MFKYILGVLLILPVLAYNQAPEAFNYQAIARDTTGNILSNQTIGIKFGILSGSITGTVEYSETHSVTTNPFGAFILAVGRGNPLFGSLSTIDWGSNSYFLKVEIDPNGGNNYTHMGTQQLLSVPYALYAEKAGNTSSSSASYFDLDYPDGVDSIQPVHLQLSSNGQNYTVPSGMNFHGIIIAPFQSICSQCPGFIINNADTLNSLGFASLSGSLPENTSVSFLQGTPASYLIIQGYVAPKRTQAVYQNLNTPYIVPAGKQFFLEGVNSGCTEIIMNGNIRVRANNSLERNIIGIFDAGTVLSSAGCATSIQGFLK